MIVRAARQQESKPTATGWVNSTVTRSERNQRHDRGGALEHRQLIARGIVGTAYTLANINARAAGTCTRRLYTTHKEGKQIGAKRHKALTHARYGKASAYAEDAVELREITEHPVLDLLGNPNKHMRTGAGLDRLRFIDKQLAGCSFLMIEDGPQREPAGLWHMSPMFTRIIPGEDELIGGYAYSRNTEVVLELPPEAVMRFVFEEHPLDPFQGRGWLEAVVTSSELEEYATTAEVARWINGGAPDYTLRFKPETSPEQIKQATEGFIQKFTGPQNAGKVWSTNAEEIVPGPSPKDMAYEVGMQRIDMVLRGAAGVPDAFLEMNDANRASSVSSMRMYVDITLWPLVAQDAEELTEQLLPRFGMNPGEHFFAYDEIREEDKDKRVERASKLFTSGLTDRDASLVIAGEEPVGGEVGAEYHPSAQAINAGGVGGVAIPGAFAPPLLRLSVEGTKDAVVRVDRGDAAGPVANERDGGPADGDGGVAATGERGEDATPCGDDVAVPPERSAAVSETDTPEGTASEAPSGSARVSSRRASDNGSDRMHIKWADPWADDGCCIHTKDDDRLTGLPREALTEIDEFASDLREWHADVRREAEAAAQAGRDVNLSSAVGDSLDKIIEFHARRLLGAGAIAGAEDLPFDADFELSPEVPRDYAVRLAREITDSTEDALNTAIRSGLEQGQDTNEIAQQISEAMGDEQIDYRSRRIARTEAQVAVQAGKEEVWRESGVDSKEWVLSPDPCPICVGLVNHLKANDRLRVPVNEPFVDVGESFARSDGKSHSVTFRAIRNGGSAHPNCLIPGQEVVVPDVLAGMRAFYSGEVVEIVLASGNRLTVTPNHMLLTDLGFVTADSIREGDNVVRCLDPKGVASLVHPDGHYRPTLIEDVFGSLRLSSLVTTSRVPVAPEYLHGDARRCHGHIDVVATDRLLLGDLEAARAELIGEPVFELGSPELLPLARERNLSAMLLRMRAAAHGDVRGEGKPLALSLAGAAHAEVHGLGATTDGRSGLDKAMSDYGSADAELLSDGLDRFAAFVQASEVVEINRQFYSSHVYDLTSLSGAYIAEGIVTHNCRCTMVPVIEGV